MAPRPGITPAPQATRTIAPRASLQTVAPLTTIWTPPARCSTAPITIFGGECDNDSCSAWPASQITSSWDAAFTFAYWNTDGQMTGTECAPPGSQAVLSFAFSPAAGCPAGYFTATTDSPGNYYSSASYSTAICCPSSYSVATQYNSGIWGCLSTITTHGQKAIVVAYGATTISDYYNGVTTYEFWLSTVSTTTIDSIPTYPPLLVNADAVPIVVSTTPWSEPTLTNGYNYPTASSLDGYGYPTTKPAHNFHIGPLNMIYSIVVVVCAGIFGLVAICCLLCCCRRRNRDYLPQRPPSYRPRPRLDSSPITPPVYPVPRTVTRDSVLPTSNPSYLEMTEPPQQFSLPMTQDSKRKNEETARLLEERAKVVKERDRLVEENRERQRKKRLADRLAERQRIEKEKIKLNPEYLYQMKVSTEKGQNKEPSYESMFDAGPTYGPPLFTVSTGNTPLALPSSKLGKLSKPKSSAKPQSPSTSPTDLPATRVTRPAATTGLNSGSRDERKEMLKAHTAETSVPSKPKPAHLSSNGPRFLVLPDVTNSPAPTPKPTPKPASSGTFTPSTSRSTPPSRSPGARNPRHTSPVNDSVSQRSSPPSTATKSRNARNTLSSPLAGPKLTVNKGGDLLTTPPAVAERRERESSPPDGLDGTRIPLSLALAALLMSEGRLARDS